MSSSRSVTMPRNSLVLDSFALLAYIGKERGRARVEELFLAAELGEVDLQMSLINLGEVLYKLAKVGAESERGLLLDKWNRYPIRFRGPGQKAVFSAAAIKSRYPIAYADSFAVALAQELDCPVLTGDPEFRKVEHLVAIEWLPR